MKALRLFAFTVVMVFSGVALAQSAKTKAPIPGSDREKLIGAWHLAWIGAPAADGTMQRTTDVKGVLIYTRDGHMSVQLMYPHSEAALSNEYVKNGYEASFGSYKVDEQAHTVTHHVQGSITPGIVGKDLTRVYRFSDGHLIIKSADPNEHWQVNWEHY